MKKVKKIVLFTSATFLMSIIALVVSTTLLVNHFSTNTITKETVCVQETGHCTTQVTTKK